MAAISLFSAIDCYLSRLGPTMGEMVEEDEVRAPYET